MKGITRKRRERIEQLHQWCARAQDKALEALDNDDKLGFIQHQKTAIDTLARIDQLVHDWTRT